MKKTAKTPAVDNPQVSKVAFKEAYYAIGDKISALETLRDFHYSTTNNFVASGELNDIIKQQTLIHQDLKMWGDKYLTNWD